MQLKPGMPWRTTLIGAAVILLGPLLFALLDSYGTHGTKWALVQLVVVNPLVYMVGTVRSWFRYGWKVLLTLVVFTAAALISVFTVYNSSALIYIGVYLVLAALCIGVAVAVHAVSDRRRRS